MGIEPTGEWEGTPATEEETIRSFTVGAVVAAAPPGNQHGEGAGTHTIQHGRLSQLHLSVMRQIHNLGVTAGQGDPNYGNSERRASGSPRDQLLQDIRRGRQLRVVNRSRQFYVQNRARRAATHPVSPQITHNSFLEEIRLGRNRVLERIVNQEARASEGSRLYPPFFAGT